MQLSKHSSMADEQAERPLTRTGDKDRESRDRTIGWTI
jgi:hypothetical protein